MNCPFITKVVLQEDGSAATVTDKCMGSNCGLWDRVDLQCSIGSIAYQLQQLKMEVQIANRQAR